MLTENPFVLTESPYAPPLETESIAVTATVRSQWSIILWMLPFSLVAAVAGGTLNRDPGVLLLWPGIHPLAPAGLVFGVCSAMAGVLIIPNRRILVMPVIPFAAMAAFGIAGDLMNLADARLRSGGSAAIFVMELSLDSFMGMALIGITFVLARMLKFYAALRWTVMGTFLGALCVVIVNGLSSWASLSFLLYWTMFLWQLLMMQYLAWLSIRPQDR